MRSPDGSVCGVSPAHPTREGDRRQLGIDSELLHHREDLTAHRRHGHDGVRGDLIGARSLEQGAELVLLAGRQPFEGGEAGPLPTAFAAEVVEILLALARPECRAAFDGTHDVGEDGIERAGLGDDAYRAGLDALGESLTVGDAGDTLADTLRRYRIVAVVCPIPERRRVSRGPQHFGVAITTAPLPRQVHADAVIVLDDAGCVVEVTVHGTRRPPPHERNLDSLVGLVNELTDGSGDRDGLGGNGDEAR